MAGTNLLVDCGAPIFQLLTTEEIAEISGVILTHSHDDHRRWLGDLALYRRFVDPDRSKLKLFATEEVHEEYKELGRSVFERNLNETADRVIETPYTSYFDLVTIGPRPKYSIVESIKEAGNRELVVRDRGGKRVGPDRAKIVLHPTAGRPRMLFNDPEEKIWVDPTVYYSQSDSRFYESEDNAYLDVNSGAKLSAFRDQCWHGPPNAGIRFEFGAERVVFGGDTAFDPNLWKRLVDERPVPSYGSCTRRDFVRATVLSGDINDFVERVWSVQRFESAISAYRDSVVFQDTATVRSVVHTDYVHIKRIKEMCEPARLICVHTPDRFASIEPMSFLDKSYFVFQNQIYEKVGDLLHPLDGDIYSKNLYKFFVGYRDPEGSWKVVETADCYLDVLPADADERSDERTLFRCRLVQDLHGGYYPVLTDSSESYRVRSDGRVECVQLTGEGSTGRVVDSAPRPVVDLVGTEGSSGFRRSEQ